MESTSARDIDRRLAELVRSERHLVVQFVVDLAGFAKRELYRELGYTSLFYCCVRQLGLSKSSAFRRSEVARLIARFPVSADRLSPPPVAFAAVPAGTTAPPCAPEVVPPPAPELRRPHLTPS